MSSVITNPGKSENVQKQASLAEAIAANLTASRTGSETPQSPEQARESAKEPAPEPERVAQPEPSPEPSPQPDPESQAAEIETEGDAPAPETGGSQESERYSLADFADAADLDVDTLLDRFDVEVTRDGKTQTTNLRDVLNGYKWDAVNTQRAQEIAEQRKQVDAKLAEIDTEHKRLSALLGAQWDDVTEAEQNLQKQYEAVDWAALRAQQNGSFADMEAQFSRARHEIEAKKRKLADAWQQAQTAANELAERQQAEAAPKRLEQLYELVPEWRDEAVARREAPEITRYVADKWGFTPQEQNAITDPRTVAAMRRLWQLERQVDDVPASRKKVKTAPKVLKPGQQTQQRNGREEVTKKLRNRLKNSGHRRDLAALILQTRRT